MVTSEMTMTMSPEGERVKALASTLSQEELISSLFSRYPRSEREKVAFWAQDKLGIPEPKVKILAPSRRRKVRWRRQ